jgi:hypothetical protein
MDVYVAAHRGSDGGRIAELELTRRSLSSFGWLSAAQ